jgi:hypothetical protein
MKLQNEEKNQLTNYYTRLERVPTTRHRIDNRMRCRALGWIRGRGKDSRGEGRAL